ncbi:Kinesin-like protein KIF22 [Fulvia fulva]|uniref:Kinesin-like protein KIF22 n=1 Tax=Passalora fulva TaxID=5499 RepID=A0A9Q8PFT4_PASFU|nr:Kinesin-like protein KIF22 [Fulvia fulva]UJO21688.1 Kinesin-like protein KIF22 [Fulvia fulva]
MSVRVVARVRPLLKNEIEKDVIVTASSAPGDKADSKSIVRIPNPKKESELYSFHFSSVYDQTATQADIFDNEISPTVKHLFKGFDVTLFAYGVTGTGKTHTMRGGKAMADRGAIPRLLSSIYRRARKLEKDTSGETQVEVAMSYYEIYNDRVFDLFEPPDKRTPAGLPIRDNQSGKAVVVGLTERPCTSLKEFEQLYDQANVNRSTSATKLNAHSSRSHAVLCVKITQTIGEEVRVGTASAIDLAGSEDNRRTDNNKDRLVESSAINKSLFVLASCVEAISKKQTRVPYRESKMTRILALGQNNGLTVMILNLAPVRSYQLDTLSSLNFANRTKKIEVNEIENQSFFRDPPAGKSKLEGGKEASAAVPSMNRQPLRPKILSHSSHLQDVPNVPKPAKSFAVFSDKPKAAPRPSPIANTAQARQSRAEVTAIKSPKRMASREAFGRPAKAAKKSEVEAGMSQDAIEALIERKVTEALAGRIDQTAVAADPISDEVQKRLDALEKRVEGQETERAEGLQYLLMAKQHQVRGEDVSALKMYQLALPHFPGNEKLVRKMSALQDKIDAQKAAKHARAAVYEDQPEPVERTARRKQRTDEDESYHEAQEEEQNYDEDEGFVYRPRTKIRRPALQSLHRPTPSDPEPCTKRTPPPDNDSDDELATALIAQTPRTKQLLEIINTKDVSQIKLLKGVGAKKAEAIVNCLCDLDDSVTTLNQLGKLKGVGVKTVENMRTGLQLA